MHYEMDAGTYRPHLEDCYICHCKWTEENQPVGWYEHYVCKKCAEDLKSWRKESP